VIVGTKADMKTTDFHKLILKKHRMFRDIDYIESSSWTNKGIDKIFKPLVTRIAEDPFYETQELSKFEGNL
jgi:hypothetical protein